MPNNDQKFCYYKKEQKQKLGATTSLSLHRQLQILLMMAWENIRKKGGLSKSTAKLFCFVLFYFVRKLLAM